MKVETKTLIPKGYHRLKNNQRLKKGDLYPFRGKWTKTTKAGLFVWGSGPLAFYIRKKRS